MRSPSPPDPCTFPPKPVPSERMIRKPAKTPRKLAAPREQPLPPPDHDTDTVTSTSANDGILGPLPAQNRGGRPRKPQGRDLLVEICARVATGETLTAISRDPGMPTPPAFRAAIARDPTLQDLWIEAKAERPHALFEEAIDLARRLKVEKWGKEDGNTVRALQVAIEALRTAAARLDPRAYGERQNAAVIVPVQINTTLGLTPGQLPPKEESNYSFQIEAPE